MINNGEKKMKATYRIQNQDGTIYGAGTEAGSWFHLEDARKIVNYNKGQRIVESNGVEILWETL